VGDKGTGSGKAGYGRPEVLSPITPHTLRVKGMKFLIVKTMPHKTASEEKICHGYYLIYANPVNYTA